MHACRWLIPLALAAATLLTTPVPASADIITSDRGGIVVGNRGTGTISVIDVATNQQTTINMPAGPNTPDPMYVVFSPANNLVYVGDRANDRVVAFDAFTFNPVAQATIPAGAGVFHMWGNVPQNQLWVVNDGAGNAAARSISVLDMVNFNTLATIPIPVSGTPHDIIVDPVNRQAYVTINGTGAGQGTVLRYSTEISGGTFPLTGSVTSGDSLHVFLTENNNFLYVLSQSAGRIDVFDRTTLTLVDPNGIPLFNAHGVDATPDGNRVYATSFPGGGQNLLVTIDPALIGILDNPIINTLITPDFGQGPHNVAVSLDGSRIYISHSGSNVVSFYDIDANGLPVFAGSFTTVAGANVFGITAIPRPVPEPGSLALIVMGGLPLAGALWRRARRAQAAVDIKGDS